MNDLHLYLHPDGDNKNDGLSLEQAKLSLHAALAAVRTARQGAPQTPATIHLGRGTFALDTVLQLTAEDSFLTIAGEGTDTILQGGDSLTTWQPDPEDARFLISYVEGVKEGLIDFRQLFMGGNPRPRAKLPHSGRLNHDSLFTQQWLGTNFGAFTPPPTLDARTTMIYPEGQLPKDLSIRNAEFTFYHCWDDSKTFAVSHDPTTRTLRLDPPCGYPPGAFNNQSYDIENIREGMHEPGQWFLDRERGCVVYWPLPDESATGLVAEYGRLHHLIQGGGTKDNPLRSVSLSNMTLRLTTVDLLSTGCGASTPTGAIELTHARQLTLHDLHIDCVGGHGIKLAETHQSSINNNQITQTGACGIVTRGDENHIAGNTITHVGRFYPGAVGMNISGLNLFIEANNISHSPYSGIILSSGLAAYFDEGPIEGGSVIRNNHVSHVMEVLEDGGCLYMTGRGNTVQGNRLHHAGRGGVGIYVDEVSDNFVIEDNVVYQIGNMPIELHANTGTVVRHNLFHAGPGIIFAFPRSKKITFEKNILLTDGLTTEWNLPEDFRISDNVVAPMPQTLGISQNATYSYPKISIGGWRAHEDDFATIGVLTTPPESYTSELGAIPMHQIPEGDFPNESDWEAALHYPALVDDAGEASVTTDTRLLRSPTNLFVRVSCHGATICRSTEKTIWASTNIEIHLQPTQSSKDGIHFTRSRCGKVIAYRHPEAADITKSHPWESRAFELEDGGWGAEFSIDLTQAPRTPGTALPAWGILIVRHDEQPDIRNQFPGGFTRADLSLRDIRSHDYRPRGEHASPYGPRHPEVLSPESGARTQPY